MSAVATRVRGEILAERGLGPEERDHDLDLSK